MSKKDIVEILLERYGQTFAREIGIPVEKNTPAPLFQLLCASLLYSARISADNAARAMKALIEAGLTTPQKMADATWQERVDVITWHGYKRYDERTSSMLGDTAELLLERYRGDLRELRDEAERDVGREHELLQQFKGIGAVGADIFLREVQVAWEEAYPYADEKVLKAARRLDLGGDAQTLARRVDRRNFPRFTAALIRLDLEDGYDDVRQAA